MKKKILYIIFFLVLSNIVDAQFYNGYQMTFGKNRVQYDPFEWQYYRFDKFDTYYYVGGSNLAQFTSQIVNEKIKEYEKFFEYRFDQRLIFQVYNNLSDFRQSNLGYITGSDENNIGGTTTIIQNRAFVYFESDYRAFEEQISAVVAELIINQMLFGGSFTVQVANSTLITMPEWYTKGLIKYMSEGWSTEADSKVRDAILSGKFENFNRLEGDDAILAGYSIWNYIANRYGKKVIPNIIYLARISKSVDSGFMFVLGTPFKFLVYDWLNYYDEQYYSDDKNRSLPKSNNEVFKTKRKRVYQQIKISLNGQYYAYTTNEMGKYIVWLFDKQTGKKRSIIRKEHRLQQITDYSYPLLAWHPSNQDLYFIDEQKGGIWLNIYNLESKKIEKQQIFKFSKILDFNFSLDGQNFVFTAVKNGQIDVFTYSLLSHTFKTITNDICDEKNAKFLSNKTSIVFASNRANDSLFTSLTQKNYDLFVYEKGKDKLKRITNSVDIDEKEPINIDNLKFLYLSDKNGIYNINLAQYDSSISFVDTTIHYHYFAKTYGLTNYKRNISEYSYNVPQSQLSGIIHYNNKDRIYSTEFSTDKKNKLTETPDSKWIIDKEKKRIKDSIQQAIEDTIRIKTIIKHTAVDTSQLDYNDYQFDVIFLSKDDKKNDSARTSKELHQKFKSIYYFTSFYNDKVVTQIDFGFLNQSYQAYTGSAVYFNPGFNVFMKMGVADMFDDYRFTAGVRLSANLNSAEYLFSLENLKTRLDKQYIFHRQVVEEYGGNVVKKTYSHQLMYILRWPFNQVSSVRGTMQYRIDNGIYKATDNPTLAIKNEMKNWLGLKVEYVYDNSLNLGINLYRGWRNKVFAEAYKQVDGAHPDLYVLGFDLRHYQKIHRSIIWASRLAGSSSFGENRLMYYLGSTDNWMNFSRQTPTFDESVKRNQNIKWAFQSLATNMRGFSQNVRNGNNFLVMNNEIRIPIIRYLSGAPVTSSFLYNLQLISFFDIGTAWTGKTPYSEDNLYNQEDRIQGPVTIIIDNQKAPFVYGYGGGVRSKLLGYFIRADLAWGIDGKVALPKIFYLSLSLDF